MYIRRNLVLWAKVGGGGGAFCLCFIYLFILGGLVILMEDDSAWGSRMRFLYNIYRTCGC